MLVLGSVIHAPELTTGAVNVPTLWKNDTVPVLVSTPATVNCEPAEVVTPLETIMLPLLNAPACKVPALLKRVRLPELRNALVARSVLLLITTPPPIAFVAPFNVRPEPFKA